MYLYPWYVSDLTATRDIKKIVGCGVELCFGVIEDDFLKLAYDVRSTKMVGDKILEKIIKERKFVDEITKKIYLLSRDLVSYCQKTKKINVSTISDQKLVRVFSEYIKKLALLRAWGWIPVFLEGAEKSLLTELLQNEFKIFLADKNLSLKFGEYYSLLSSTEKMSAVQKEELERLTLLISLEKEMNVKKIKNAIKNKNYEVVEKTSFNKKLVTHQKRFGWLTYAYSGPPMTQAELFDLLKESLSGGDPKKQREKILKRFAKINKEKKLITKKLNLPENLVYLFRVSSELMFIKDYRKGIYQKSYVAMDKILNEMANRIGVNLKEIKYLSGGEIRRALLGGKKKRYAGIAKKRTIRCCYLARDGKIKISEGKLCDRLIEKMMPKEDERDKTIKKISGMVAFHGNVRGRVKLILNQSDIIKMKAGDIMVSPATNPDLIIAMKKARAIITDTGGIISHAAIVSRELKIPCVVGTKNATKFLADGDMVEVDAEKGFITKLN